MLQVRKIGQSHKMADVERGPRVDGTSLCHDSEYTIGQDWSCQTLVLMHIGCYRGESRVLSRTTNRNYFKMNWIKFLEKV